MYMGIYVFTFKTFRKTSFEFPRIIVPSREAVTVQQRTLSICTCQCHLKSDFKVVSFFVIFCRF